MLGNLLLCTSFMNSFTSESEMIRELNMGTDCSASVQLDTGFELQEIGEQVVKPVLGQVPKSQALKAAGTTTII